MDQETVSLVTANQLENFFLNQNIEINFTNFIIAIILSLILAYFVKLTYVRVGRALNDKEYFSDTFIPLAVVTTLVITVIKFSLALSLGLVGALSIVRFRAAIKEPEELVYLFFIIAIGLANGANQFILSIASTVIIILFLFIRKYYQDKKSPVYKINSDSNILNVVINDNKSENINDIIKKIEPNLKYLKLKSANIEDNTSNYVFWYDLDDSQFDNFLNYIKSLSNKNLTLSIYSKTGAFE